MLLLKNFWPHTWVVDTKTNITKAQKDIYHKNILSFSEFRAFRVFRDED
jgi:hypothetical protein